MPKAAQIGRHRRSSLVVSPDPILRVRHKWKWPIRRLMTGVDRPDGLPRTGRPEPGRGRDQEDNILLGPDLSSRSDLSERRWRCYLAIVTTFFWRVTAVCANSLPFVDAPV